MLGIVWPAFPVTRPAAGLQPRSRLTSALLVGDGEKGTPSSTLNLKQRSQPATTTVPSVVRAATEWYMRAMGVEAMRVSRWPCGCGVGEWRGTGERQQATGGW